jgi:hypothetical protein
LFPSPRRIAKRTAGELQESEKENPGISPNKVTKIETPNSTAKKSLFKTPNAAAASPSKTSNASLTLRKRRIERPLWKTLSLNMKKDKMKKDENPSLFRSPSIYSPTEANSENKKDVMSSYLSGKICPLTPSQKQTDISHLVSRKPTQMSPIEVSQRKLQQELKEKLTSPRNAAAAEESEDEEFALVPASEMLKQTHSGNGGFCIIM